MSRPMVLYVIGGRKWVYIGISMPHRVDARIRRHMNMGGATRVRRYTHLCKLFGVSLQEWCRIPFDYEEEPDTEAYAIMDLEGDGYHLLNINKNGGAPTTSQISRMGGLVGGRISAPKLVAYHQTPDGKESLIRAGRISGRINAHVLAAYRQTPEGKEALVRGGRAAGLITIKALLEWRKSNPEVAREASSRGARNQSLEAKAKGGRRAGQTWAKTHEAREVHHRGGLKTAHVRYHRDRHIFNVDCLFCRMETAK